MLTYMFRSSCPEVFYKKGVLKTFAKTIGKHLCQSLFCNFIEKENLAQVFSREFSKILRAPFSYRTSPVAAGTGEMESYGEWRLRFMRSCFES